MKITHFYSRVVMLATNYLLYDSLFLILKLRLFHVDQHAFVLVTSKLRRGYFFEWCTYCQELDFAVGLLIIWGSCQITLQLPCMVLCVADIWQPQSWITLSFINFFTKTTWYFCTSQKQPDIFVLFFRDIGWTVAKCSSELIAYWGHQS